MASNSQFKVNQIAQDLGMKSKAVVDLLAGKGVEVKTQKTLDQREFDLLMDNLTKENQIKDIDAYMSGET